jgi:DNA-binding response OmpR family regulator
LTLRPLDILVVEDDILIGLDIQSVLEGAGHCVIGPAMTVAAALALIGQVTPHIALLDIGLGRANAFELVDRLAGMGAKVIFLSGYPRSMIPEAHRQCRLVAKPFLPDVLLAAIRVETCGESESGLSPS